MDISQLKLIQAAFTDHSIVKITVSAVSTCMQLGLSHTA